PLTATPDSGYQFKEWQVISGGVTVTGSKFTMPAGTVEIKAVFEAIFSATYTVTVNNGTGGGSYAAGATVTITANAAPAGQEFDKWVATGVTLRNPSVASLSFTMPVGAVTVTATYKALPPSAYVITVTSGGNGTASASAASATQGTEITLTATPDSGYQFKEWQVISGGVTVTGNKFTMPASNVIVKAIFEANGAAIVAPTIAPDKNVTLHYRGETQLNNFVTGDGLTWSSSNPKYVTVDPNTGKITSQKSFIKTGSATITAQNSAGKVVFNVKVRPTFWQWILIIVLFGWIWY
ncbi:MAG: hypothetical protein FWC27_10070, partial [Firmicutes bacterium]|nr:hypothetical protein [Bacillota bacterium]